MRLGGTPAAWAIPSSPPLVWLNKLPVSSAGRILLPAAAEAVGAVAEV